MSYTHVRSHSLTLALFLLTALAFTEIAFSQVKPDSVRQNAWQQFRAQNGSKWTVRWNPKTGMPASVTSGLSKSYSGPPVQVAKTFLEEHHFVEKQGEGRK